LLKCRDKAPELAASFKRRLVKLLGKAKHAIRFNEHLAHDGASVFDRP